MGWSVTQWNSQGAGKIMIKSKEKEPKLIKLLKRRKFPSRIRKVGHPRHGYFSVKLWKFSFLCHVFLMFWRISEVRWLLPSKLPPIRHLSALSSWTPNPKQMSGYATALEGLQNNRNSFVVECTTGKDKIRLLSDLKTPSIPRFS